MNNTGLITKISRRLDKFSFDELVVVSELSENEVSKILAKLVNKQIILQNNNTYFFNTKKSAEIIDNKNIQVINGFQPIVIENEYGYDDFLKFGKDTQEKIRTYVELINFVNGAGDKNLKQLVELFNQTSGYKRIPYSSFTKIRSNFNKYGFKGILPAYNNDHIESSVPEELYVYFKKYYLTKEKLSVTEAIYKAQKQLQAEQKIEQPYAYSSTVFLKKLKSEFDSKQIEYFRNNIEPQRIKIGIKKGIQEPLDMLFQDAAKIYFKRLKSENKLERIMHQKTDYKNHLEEYFGDLKIREITNKIVAKYKQKEFDNGYQLISVNNYIMTLKNIINEVCPETNYLRSRKKKLNENAYAMDMNLLTDGQIVKLLDICYKKYNVAYPILYIALSTGASIPELLRLTWDRIDFDNRIISLKYFLYGNKLIMNKCNSTMRRLKINDYICTILKNKFNKLKPAPNDFVFKFDSPKSPQQYIENVVLKGLSAHLGIKRLYPSDMQHNFVNICLKQNIPLTFIQKSLGYYGIVNFIQIYRKLIENLENDNYNPLDMIYSRG